jgi:hypothetical protein
MSFWLFLVGGLMGRFGHNGVVSNSTTWVIDGNKAASNAVTACSFLFVASFATTWVCFCWSDLTDVRALFLGHIPLKSLRQMFVPKRWPLRPRATGLSTLHWLTQFLPCWNISSTRHTLFSERSTLLLRSICSLLHMKPREGIPNLSL